MPKFDRQGEFRFVRKDDEEGLPLRKDEPVEDAINRVIREKYEESLHKSVDDILKEESLKEESLKEEILKEEKRTEIEDTLEQFRRAFLRGNPRINMRPQRRRQASIDFEIFGGWDREFAMSILGLGGDDPEEEEYDELEQEVCPEHGLKEILRWDNNHPVLQCGHAVVVSSMGNQIVEGVRYDTSDPSPEGQRSELDQRPNEWGL